MKVTRIIKSQNLNKGKYNQLSVQAKRLGKVRSEVWHDFGSVNGVSIRNDRKIRDQWLSAKRHFKVSANAWKETLRDSFGDIKASREAAKVQSRKVIYKQVTNEEKRNELYKLLKEEKWTSNNYLRRLMRHYWKHGRNHIHNQIVVRSDNYTTFQLGGRAWIKIPSLQFGKRIAIPLNSCVVPTGTLRLILIEGLVEVHYTIDVPESKNGGTATVGIDKGYTEVFVDSEGQFYGEGLGKLLTSKSDYLKNKYKNRSKLRAIANNKPNKKPNIIQNNLGRKKLNRQDRKTKSIVRDIIYQATHQLVDKASIIAAEDLTSPIASKKFGKNVTRRLSAWTKGVIATALDTVSRRRSSSVILVNSAYTSQMDSRDGTLSGKRRGDSFHCEDGVVLQADENAARNVLARLHDQEIDRWTPWKNVKSILLKRTERQRLGLLKQDSSCNSSELSTESELPKNVPLGAE
jgi:IS605 OrfB family transposase